MSSATSVNDTLAGYVAGRVTAENVVATVAAAYYGDGGRGTRDGLRPLMEIIERAHPGVVELAGSAEKPGFAVRLAERPFPKRYEAEFRQGVQALLVGGAAAVALRPGFWSRLYSAVRKMFGA